MEYVRGKGYHAKIILDSVGPSGKRITTWELRYPRMVHSELLTHRLLSRNSASSRAIPNEKLIAQVLDDPAMPVWWGKNQSGMQAREELSATPWPFVPGCKPRDHDLRSDLTEAVEAWLKGRDEAVNRSRILASLGLHKQIANRVIEPWMFITVIVTATEWDNWYAQRDHADAQPEIAWIARLMHEEYAKNEPRSLDVGGWHLPLVDRLENGWLRLESLSLIAEGCSTEDLKRISAGRCARVSYLTHDGRRAPDEDIALAAKLASSSPGHWSPFEHVAQALPKATLSGNFIGWKQFRKEFANEHIGGPRP